METTDEQPIDYAQRLADFFTGEFIHESGALADRDALRVAERIVNAALQNVRATVDIISAEDHDNWVRYHRGKLIVENVLLSMLAGIGGLQVRANVAAAENDPA